MGQVSNLAALREIVSSWKVSAIGKASYSAASR